MNFLINPRIRRCLQALETHNYASLRIIFIFIFILLLGFYVIPVNPANAQTSNNSVRFSGGSKIRIPVTSSAINIGAGNFTLEFWLKISGVSAGSTCNNGADNFTEGGLVIDRDIWGPGDFGDFGISVMSDRRLAFSVHNGAGGVTACSTALALNTWYYIAAVKSGNNISIYVNGALSQSRTFSGSSNLSYNIGRGFDSACPNPCQDPYLVLGAEKHAVGYNFNGLMDELRISNSARAISGVPTAPFPIDGNTVAMYRFEGNATDSDAGFNGTNFGATYSTDTPSFTVATANPTANPTSVITTNPTKNPTANPTNKPTTTTATTSPSTTTPTVSGSNTPAPSDFLTPSPTNEIDPEAQQRISIRIFEDKNNNSKFDSDEAYGDIEKIEVKALDKVYTAQKGENGLWFVDLPLNLTNVEVSVQSKSAESKTQSFDLSTSTDSELFIAIKPNRQFLVFWLIGIILFTIVIVITIIWFIRKKKSKAEKVMKSNGIK
jgi:Concanavalin A-like lectin/glucanases superfamily